MRIPLRLTLPDGGLSRFVTSAVFVAFGLGYMVWSHLEGFDYPGWRRYVPYAAGGLFVLIGVASFIRELRRGAARDAAQRTLEEHRDEPWRVRPEWRSEELAATPPLDRSFLVLTLFWNLFSWPLAFLLIRGEMESGNSAVWLVATFPLIGVGLAAKVGYEFLRARKYRGTAVKLDPMPLRLGRPLRGTLRTTAARDARPDDGVLVRVSCYRQRVRYTRDSDGDRTRKIERDLLWRDETRVRDRPVAYGGTVEVPFAFELPVDAPPSTPLKLDNRILWEVSAEAEVPGIDFAARVEVPVFPPEEGSVAEGPSDTGEASEIPGGDGGAVPSDPTGSALDPNRAWPFEEPLTEGIRLMEEPERFELHFTAARNRKTALVFGVFGVVLLLAGVPLLFASALVGLIMLLMGGFLIFGAIQKGTNDTVVRVEGGRIRVTHDGVGMPPDIDVAVGQVEEVLVHLGTSSSGENATYAISLVARPGEGLEHVQAQADQLMKVLSRFGVDESHPAMEATRKGAERPRILVAGDLSDKDEADWLGFRIRQAVEREGGAAV